MLRNVQPSDAPAIAAIYNEYILHSVITFDTEPVTEATVRSAIIAISKEHPYLVYEENGLVRGFCYAHTWKSKEAYRLTWETTLYLAKEVQGKGIGTLLMKKLIEESRAKGAKALIACITEGNAASERLHRKLDFRQVSHFKNVGSKFGRELDVVDYELLI